MINNNDYDIITYLNKYKNLYEINLITLQKYVEVTTLKLYSSDESREIINNLKILVCILNIY